MDTNQTSPQLEDVQQPSTQEQEPTPEPTLWQSILYKNDSVLYKKVIPSAETILYHINLAICIVVLIIAIVMFVVGIIQVLSGDSFGVIIISRSAFAILATIGYWALIQVFINISRNLFNLNTRIDQLEKSIKK